MKRAVVFSNQDPAQCVSCLDPMPLVKEGLTKKQKVANLIDMKSRLKKIKKGECPTRKLPQRLLQLPGV